VARLLLEYDGTRFAGWARQPGQRTVQDELERALGVVLRRPSGDGAPGGPGAAGGVGAAGGLGGVRPGGVRLTVAGRTDRGVHAWGQVASYEGEPASVTGLNALLPGDVAVRLCEAAPEGWSARHDATSRAYCYRVLARPARSALEAGRALWWPHPIDLDLLEECAAALVGTHDFTAFTPTETDHVRFEREVFAAEWRVGWASDVLELWIEADAFMRQMNRVLVGTMLEVAGRRRLLDDFTRLLSGRPRSEAGKTALAHGLYLAGVGYGGERVLEG
jgi:tRNA pseudouridine38-40 synthase